MTKTWSEAALVEWERLVDIQIREYLDKAPTDGWIDNMGKYHPFIEGPIAAE